jgi:hypothetical protein
MLRLRFRLFSAATALVLAALLLTALSGVAHADTLLFANITNAQENPPAVPTLVGGVPRPASFGVAGFVLNDAMTQMTFSATVFNIDFTGMQTADPNDNLVAAHIHAGPLVTPLVNGPVVWGFFGLPFNETAPNDQLVTPFGMGMVGGVISGKWDLTEGNNTTLAAQISNILEGRSYINFHTTQFPGGEARGAIAPVPEPSAISLLFAGTVVLLGAFRRIRESA